MFYTLTHSPSGKHLRTHYFIFLTSHTCEHYFIFLTSINSSLMQAGRVKSVVSDGVKEIWLSSEDTGAYGNF